MTENELREMARETLNAWLRDKASVGVQMLLGYEASALVDRIAAALLKAKEAGERQERERCRMIRPEPDIEEVTDAYSDGYTEGFADACARFRSAVDPSIWYGDIRPIEEIRRDEAERRDRQDTGRG